MTPSGDAVASTRPSGENAAAAAPVGSPSDSGGTRRPVATSHTNTWLPGRPVRSWMNPESASPAVTSSRPSGENASPCTSCMCPGRSCNSVPLATSHSRTAYAPSSAVVLSARW